MSSLPSELLSHVIELAYPALDERMVDYDGGRARKAGLLDAMLVCRQWYGLARPLHDSFMVFGSAEEVEEWIERAEAGEIEPTAVKDVTIRPVFDTEAVVRRVEHVRQIAAEQTGRFMAMCGVVRHDLWVDVHDDILEAVEDIRIAEESAYVAGWSTALRRLLARLSNLVVLRFTELEIFLDSRAVSNCCRSIAVHTVEWESALDDPNRDDSNLEDLWDRMWRFLDAQPRLVRLAIRQKEALPSGHQLKWANGDMTSIPDGLGARIQFVTIAGEFGKWAPSSTMLAVDMPALKSLIINDAGVGAGTTLLNAMASQQSLRVHLALREHEGPSNTRPDPSAADMIAYFFARSSSLSCDVSAWLGRDGEDEDRREVFTALVDEAAGDAGITRPTILTLQLSQNDAVLMAYAPAHAAH